jgi:hypothetical protein
MPICLLHGASESDGLVTEANVRRIDLIIKDMREINLYKSVLGQFERRNVLHLGM